MKRYMLFKGAEFYPCGGMYDFVRAFEDKDEAVSDAFYIDAYEWAHVYDIEEQEIIFKKG
jgi:hypothetical protein